MIELEIEDKIVQVKPHLTIQQYQRLKSNEEKYQNSSVETLSLYTDIPVNQLKDLPLEQVNFVQEYITSQITTNSMKDELHNIFTHNGIEYGLENDWTKLAWGGWVDLEVFASDKIEDNIHYIMAVLYRPVIDRKKNKYTIKPYKADDIEDRANEFLTLPVNYWFGASVFFFIIGNLYISNLESSLIMKNKVNKMMMKGWEILPKWVKKKLPLDSILISHINSQTKI
jgi:hypothetical protein